MSVPNLAPGYLGQMKSIEAQRKENERNRQFESSQASSNFLRTLGRDVLGAGLGIGADIAGTAFRDSLTRDERAAAQGTFYPEDTDTSAAIRQAAEARAATELRPQASFGEAAETGFGRRGIDTGAPTLGGAKADVLRPAGPPSVTPGVTPLVTQLRASEPVKRPEYAGAFDPPGITARGMESEAPRRPLPAPQSAPMAQPRPMAPQATREAQGGYQPPRMMPSTAAAMARETGYRDSIPSLPTSVRGLAQQSQDVRDERALGLELMRKKLLWDEQQATANVAMMQQRGASATAIAAARAKEADAKAKAEEMRQLDLLMSARSRGAPKYVKGLGVYTPPQTVLPTGNTDDGLRGDIVPQDPMGRQGGTGRGGAPGGAQPGDMQGNAMMVVRQNRNKQGVETGPGQPVLINIGQPLFRTAVDRPTDLGFKQVEDVAALKAAYREYNAAMPGAKSGDPMEVAKFTTAQNTMVELIRRAQDTYRTEVADTRDKLGLSPRDMGATAARNDEKLEQKLSGQTAALAGAAGELGKLKKPAEITTDSVKKALQANGFATPVSGRIAVMGTQLMPAIYQAAVNGDPAPAVLGTNAASVAAYNAVVAEAAKTRQKLAANAETKRAADLQKVGLGLQAKGFADPIGAMTDFGVELPPSFTLPELPAVRGSQAQPAAPQAPAQPALSANVPGFASKEDAMKWVGAQPWTAAQKVQVMDKIKADQGL